MTNGQDKLLDALTGILSEYQRAFADKAYSDENNDHDVLMDVFGITPELKRETGNTGVENSGCVGRG